MRRPFEYDGVGPDAKLFAVLSFAAAALTVACVVTSASPAPAEPAELLAYFKAHRGGYIAAAMLILAWVAFSLPFVALLRDLLGEGRRTLASAAALLCAAGIAMLGFGSFAGIGSFFALDAASSGIAARLQAPYQAAIWRNMAFLLTDPGLMTLGAGQALFAWLALRTSMPRWLAVIGFVGGIAGLLTLAVYQTPLLAIVQLLAFALWACVVGVAVLKSPRA